MKIIGLKEMEAFTMQRIKHYFWIGVLALLLTACGNAASSKTEIIIKPYNMSEQERLLVSKTDVSSIVFFELSGTLAEADDLQMSVDVYENGKFKEELLKTWGAVEKRYKNELISFGLSGFGYEGDSFKLMSGIPSGLATADYTHGMTSSSFTDLINQKIILKKNEPVYLAAWIGTTTDSLRSLSEGNGELPEGIEEAELALVYKVVLTEQQE